MSSKDGSTLDLDDSWEQLMLLRGVTGGGEFLHEAQVLQLKIWPLLAAEHASSCRVEVDTIKKVTDFHLKVAKGKKAPLDFKDRLDGLDRSVKAMLGNEWLIRVHVLSKVIYRGTRKVLEVKDGRGDRVK